MSDKIGVCIPLVDRRVESDFFLSFIELELPPGVESKIYTPHFPNGFPHEIAQARNNLIWQALKDECTHVIMMDTDQVHPPDTITRLYNLDKDIAAGVVHRRYPPFDPIFYMGTPSTYTHVNDDEVYSGDVIKVDATGCGCVMFKAEVLKKMPAPWFKLDTNEKGELVGEDIYFFSKAREAGIEIHVDTGLWIDHISTFRVNRATYELFKKFKNFSFKPEKGE